jgi:glutathione reductase (NADPH)
VADFDFDLFVIGAGSGGVRASRISAQLGAKVAICEDDRLGGTCVNRGCIPKKFYVYASHFPEEFEDARGYGWSEAKPSFDWPKLVAAKEKELKRLNGIYGNLLDAAGVEVIRGCGTIPAPNTVEVAGERYSARHILIATGGHPTKPEIEGAELGITSDEAFDLKALPKRIAIVGGGYIAVEFATIFNGLGVETTLYYRGELPLRGFDHDVRAFATEELAKKGIDIRLGTNLTKLEKHKDGIRTHDTQGEQKVFGQVMFATGRAPKTHGLGLDRLGVEMKADGAIQVGLYSQSSVEGIHAIGDVTDRFQLTPVAIHEAMCLARTLFGSKPTQPDHRDIATAVFCRPEIAVVGLTEEEARAEYGDVAIYRTSFRELKHTISGRDEKTLMKLVVDKASDRVLGAHMVGSHAGEIVQGLAIAIKCRATKAQFDATIGIHPTSAEEFVTMREPVKEEARKAAE